MPDLYLFTGDSITDAGRFTDPDRNLGEGYVRRLDESLRGRGAGSRVVNTGIGGHRAADLRSRWKPDVLDHRPALLSILVGINDTWRRYDSDDPTTAESYAADYRALLEALDRDVTRTLVLIEPFLVPLTGEQEEWRLDLDPKIAVVRDLAREFDAILVPADVELNRHAAELGAGAIAFDGVHPSDLGHRLLAQLWLEHVRP